jgi:serine/threonine protein kinase
MTSNDNKNSIRCKSCGHDNEHGIDFCVTCGSPLVSNPLPKSGATPGEPTLKPGTTLKGTYEIIRLLGEGGAGTVYEGKHITLGHSVAIKVLLSKYTQIRQVRDRFIEEGRIQANLKHPNLVYVSDIIEENDSVAIVMEYVEGQTLHHLIQKNRGQLNPQTCVSIILRVLTGLNVAHQNRIVHRDIKPGNILLANTEAGVIPMVCDFGIAKGETDHGLTTLGTKMGTLHYMAPEQFQDAHSVDERADIYAIGITLFEMLTRRLPFESKNEYALMRAHLDVRPPSPKSYRPDLEAGLESIILKSLEKRPMDRFCSCEEMAQALISIPAFSAHNNYRLSPVAADISPVRNPPISGAVTYQHTKTRLTRNLSSKGRENQNASPLDAAVPEQQHALFKHKISLLIFLLSSAILCCFFLLDLKNTPRVSDGIPTIVTPDQNDGIQTENTIIEDETSPAALEFTLSDSFQTSEEALSRQTCRSLVDLVSVSIERGTAPLSVTTGAQLLEIGEGCRAPLREGVGENPYDQLFSALDGDILTITRHLYRIQQLLQEENSPMADSPEAEAEINLEEKAEMLCVEFFGANRAYGVAIFQINELLRSQTLADFEGRSLITRKETLQNGQIQLQMNHHTCLQ